MTCAVLGNISGRESIQLGAIMNEFVCMNWTIMMACARPVHALQCVPTVISPSCAGMVPHEGIAGGCASCYITH